MKPEVNVLSIFNGRAKRIMRDSEFPRLGKKVLNERELVTKAAELAGLSVTEFIRAATLRAAKGEHTFAEKRRAMAGKPARGVAGAADIRLQNAAREILSQGGKLSPSQLRRLGHCTYQQAAAWLKRNQK